MADPLNDFDAVNLRTLQAMSTSGNSHLGAGGRGLFRGTVPHSDTGTALGDFADATGEQATAVGTRAEATGDNATAVGHEAEANGEDSTAVGQASRASTQGSTALGQGAEARHANATAVGHGARTTRSGQMALGTAANTYTMPGIASSASRAAQSGPLEVVTSDRSGNLASDGGAIFARLDGHERRLDKGMEGAALAVALQTPMVPSDRRFAMSGGWGHFEGENGLAFTGAMRLNRNVQLEGGLGLGVSHSTIAGRAGATVTW